MSINPLKLSFKGFSSLVKVIEETKVMLIAILKASEAYHN
jgi:hypothetical protein